MSAFLTIALLHFLALVSPGPDFAIVVKNSVLYERRAALYTALGTALGVLVHISYCVLGFAFILAHSLTLFTAIKWLGASYLIYIGIKALLAAPPLPTATNANTVATLSARQAVKQGFFCNALNPKAGLFFIGLFTLVIQPNHPHWLVQGFYGLWMSGTTFAWFAVVALAITHTYFRDRIARAQFWLSKLMGALLLIFGLRLFFLQSP